MNDSYPLPVSRLVWLSPLLSGLALAINPLFSAWRMWPAHFWEPLLFALLGAVVGAVVALQALARQWAVIRRQGDQLVLVPGRGLEWLPTWFAGGVLGRRLLGPVQLPVAGASLEWVGKTLLLHGNPNDVYLGRGRRAEGILVWLRAQGLGEPVGP